MKISWYGLTCGCSLLVLIANVCYKTQQYMYAAKAFDLLEKMDDSPEYWEGKRGACIGVFQHVISGKEPKESLLDVLALLQTSNNFQVRTPSLVTMLKWWKLSWLTWSLRVSAYMITGSSFTAKYCCQLMQNLCITWQKYRIPSDCLSFLCYVGWRWTSSVESSRCGPRRTEPCPWVQYNNNHLLSSLRGEVPH